MARKERIAVDVVQRAKIVAWLVNQNAVGKLADLRLDQIAAVASRELGFEVPARVVGITCRGLGYVYKLYKHPEESGTIVSLRREVDALANLITEMNTRYEKAISALHARILHLERCAGHHA